MHAGVDISALLALLIPEFHYVPKPHGPERTLSRGREDHVGCGRGRVTGVVYVIKSLSTTGRRSDYPRGRELAADRGDSVLRWLPEP